MADMPKLKYRDLVAKYRDAINAHAAVMSGVATHAEKEQDARQRRYVELQAMRRLEGKVK